MLTCISGVLGGSRSKIAGSKLKLGPIRGKMKKVACGINLLYQDVSNGTNCHLDPAIFDLLPRKIFKNKKGLLNFAANGKLDLRLEIIQFLVNLAMEVKKAVGFRIGF